jgi:hypothetical protein
MLLRELLAPTPSKTFKKIWAAINIIHAEKILRAACYCSVNTLLNGARCGTACENHQLRSFDVEHLAVLGLAGCWEGNSFRIYRPRTEDGDVESLRGVWGWLRSGAVPGGLELHNYLESRALAEVKRRGRRDG